MRYGNWLITFNPPPIPIRTMDWEFVHDAYDGPGSRRTLSGHAGDVEEAVALIKEIEEEWED